MLKRIRELDAEIAQHERNLREGEARLPGEEQLRLRLRRLINSEMLSWRARFGSRSSVSRYSEGNPGPVVFSDRLPQLKITGSVGLCTLLSLLRCGIFFAP